MEKEMILEEFRQSLTNSELARLEQVLQERDRIAREEGYTKALREIDIGSYDYVKSRRRVAKLSGVPMMAITFDEHVDVIAEKLQDLTTKLPDDNK